MQSAALVFWAAAVRVVDATLYPQVNGAVAVIYITLVPIQPELFCREMSIVQLTTPKNLSSFYDSFKLSVPSIGRSLGYMYR